MSATAPAIENARAEIVFDNDSSFTLGGERLVIDMSAQNRRISDHAAFTIVKNEAYIRYYETLASQLEPRTILELGIFQGGGYVFLDKLFKPRCMSALDISDKPVEPLVAYVARTENRHAHFGISQTDAVALRKIVAEDLGGVLEFVVDDASHSYEQTKRSFEILFPLLVPGGTYVIEDWAWAHHPPYQAANATFAHRPALTNLLFEQILLMGSSNLIADIRVRKALYVVQKAQIETAPEEPLWNKIRMRERNYFHI